MASIFCGEHCGNAVAEGCDLLDELAHLDTLLEDVESKRYELTRKCCVLKRKINRCHSPIIGKLPADVMSTIFKFCVPDFADLRLRSSKADLSVPLTLGAICSYWREIVWSTPCIWSSLTVPTNTGNVDSHKTIVQEWLARSGQLPLSIRIVLNDRFPYRAVSALLDVINQYSGRWSDLSLSLPRHFYKFLHATNNHAPMLKSIECHDYLEDDYAQFTTRNFQLFCPRLESVDLSCWPLDGINIQLDNVKNINLQYMYTEDCFLILCKTPRLVFCKISNLLSAAGPSTGCTALTILTSLRSLLITSSITCDLLDYLSTPHLEELSLPSMQMETITSFLKRSACPLRSFSTVITTSASFEAFTSLLQLMPSLKTLSITLADSYNHSASEDDSQNILRLVVARILSSQSTILQPEFLPNLEVLEYTATGVEALPTGDYSDLYPLPPTDNAVHGPFHLLKLGIYANSISKSHLLYLSSLAERGIRVQAFSGAKDVLRERKT